MYFKYIFELLFIFFIFWMRRVIKLVLKKFLVTERAHTKIKFCSMIHTWANEVTYQMIYVHCYIVRGRECHLAIYSIYLKDTFSLPSIVLIFFPLGSSPLPCLSPVTYMNCDHGGPKGDNLGRVYRRLYWNLVLLEGATWFSLPTVASTTSSVTMSALTRHSMYSSKLL
jgi:hypothetical protein